MTHAYQTRFRYLLECLLKIFDEHPVILIWKSSLPPVLTLTFNLKIGGSSLVSAWSLHVVSLPRCINGYRRHDAGGEPCDGLASHPGGVEIVLVASCYRNRVKLRTSGRPVTRVGLLWLVCDCYLPTWQSIDTQITEDTGTKSLFKANSLIDTYPRYSCRL